MRKSKVTKKKAKRAPATKRASAPKKKAKKAKATKKAPARAGASKGSSVLNVPHNLRAALAAAAKGNGLASWKAQALQDLGTGRDIKIA